ncbi:hypothetical protein AX16_007915 [Volvariella volvacea WC 439]|nr:hypothetical protein AX16_007915 [Volvariella volvacea WC 439]
MADIPSIILGTLRDVGDWAPIPLLPTIASLTLSVYEIAMTVQENKEAVKSLARDTIDVSYIIITGLQHEGRNGVKYTSQIEADLRALLDDLHRIEVFVKKYRDKRKWYTKTFSHQPDKGAIVAHRKALNSTLTKFGLKSNIELRLLVGQLVNEQKKISDGLAQNLQSKPKETLVQDVYGSMLPAKFGISTQESAGGTVTVSHAQGNDRVKPNSECSGHKVTNINSGNSYTFACYTVTRR